VIEESMEEEPREGKCSLAPSEAAFELGREVRGGAASAEAKSNIPVQGTASGYKGMACKHSVFRNCKWFPCS